MINIKGQGHPIDLDVDVPDCQLQDFLALAVKTEPPVMSADQHEGKAADPTRHGKGLAEARLGG